MIDAVFDTVQGVQGRVRELAERLEGRRRQAEHVARGAAFDARAHAEDKLWSLNLGALSRVHELLDRAAIVPGLDTVRPRLRELVATWESATTRPPVAGYDEQNVRAVLHDLHTHDRLGLLRIRHWEAAHKNRKTILDAVDRELERRARYARA